jgi:hypothetical protein
MPTPSEYLIAYEALGVIYSFRGVIPRKVVNLRMSMYPIKEIRKALRHLIKAKIIAKEIDERDGEEFFNTCPGFENLMEYRTLVRQSQLGRKEALERV